MDEWMSGWLASTKKGDTHPQTSSICPTAAQTEAARPTMTARHPIALPEIAYGLRLQGLYPGLADDRLLVCAGGRLLFQLERPDIQDVADVAQVQQRKVQWRFRGERLRFGEFVLCDDLLEIERFRFLLVGD